MVLLVYWLEESTPYTDSKWDDKVSTKVKNFFDIINTDWKMIKQKDLADEVCSIMVQGPIKITPQSAISKLMLSHSSVQWH